MPTIPTKFQDDIRSAQVAQKHYEHTSERDALNTAIGAWERILTDGTFSEAPQASQLGVFNNAGGTYLSRYWAQGTLPDLDRSIDLFKQAIAILPPDTAGRAMILSNLGSGLRDRYKRSGELPDLNAAIKALQQAVEATPPYAPERAAYLHNLGLGLKNRYEHSGQLQDLEAAIKACQQAVAATPPDAPQRAEYLHNLGNVLRDLYGHSGQVEDFEAAIRSLDQAVEATPPGAGEPAGLLSHRGLCLSNRYLRSGQLADLEAAIKDFERAVAATPPGAPGRARYLNNFGLGLSTRYDYSGQHEDLNAAIEAFDQAVAVTPADAPERAGRLGNLGGGLKRRYELNEQVDDLEAAIDTIEKAVAVTRGDAPERAAYLNNLGACLADRYGISGQLEDLEAAKSAYRCACDIGLQILPEAALMGARSWGKWALERHIWEEAVEAYNYGIQAVELLLQAQLLRSSKETWLREIQGLSSNAAYALARIGDLERAVEVAEGGRARLLAKALERSRHDLEQLAARGHNALLVRYREAEARWAELSAGAELASEAASLGRAERRDALVEARTELDAVVKAVRQVPGYEGFLRPSTFAQIQAAARGAPLVQHRINSSQRDQEQSALPW
jgi:tetratricopeptide (TPR) repeat protein